MESSSLQITVMTGPSLIAIILNWGFFGVLSIQVYFYSEAFPRDRLGLKSLVYGVYLLEMAQTCLLTQTAWKQFVSGYGNPEQMDLIGTTWLSIYLIGGLVELLVQLYYIYRIATFSQNRIIAGAILLLSMTSFGAAIVTSVYAERIGRFSELLQHKSPTFIAVGVWLATGSVCDVLILACMCHCLRSRSKHVRSETQACVSKLRRLIIETGALTAVMSIICLALFYSEPLSNSGYYRAPMTILAEVYSTSLLAIINCRTKLGIVLDDEAHIPSSLIQFTNSDGTKATAISSKIPLESTGDFGKTGQVLEYNV